VGLGYQLMQLTASGHPSQQDKSINLNNYGTIECVHM
jgi:hypothetical protein